MITKKTFFYVLAPSMIAAIAVSLETSKINITTRTPLAINRSSDGSLSVTTYKDHTILLEDIKHHHQIIITKHASKYPARFIKNTHDIKWQDNIKHRYHTLHYS